MSYLAIYQRQWFSSGKVYVVLLNADDNTSCPCLSVSLCLSLVSSSPFGYISSQPRKCVIMDIMFTFAGDQPSPNHELFFPKLNWNITLEAEDLILFSWLREWLQYYFSLQGRVIPVKVPFSVPIFNRQQSLFPGGKWQWIWNGINLQECKVLKR